MRSSLSIFAPSRRTSVSDALEASASSNYDHADDCAADVDAEHETSVVRYFTTRLMLRYIAHGNDENDEKPSGSGSGSGSSDEQPGGAATLLSIYEPNGSPCSSRTISAPASLLGKSPALVVIPPVAPKSLSANPPRVTTAVFTIIPAEGFEKEHGQPVYYNDPIELVDQFGRIMGIASRSPHAGHLAADGHGGALVVVFERRKRKEAPCSSRLLKACSNSSSTVSEEDVQYQLQQKLGLRRLTSGASAVEMCGGDRVCIPGLICVRKKAFPGGCVMQHKFFSEASTKIGEVSSSEFLTCEVVVTSGNTQLPIDVNPLLGGTDSVTARSRLQMADRTATGEFVGVLHFGILHRRSDHTRMWKKRFFVLTQAALHRFEAHVTLESSRTAKSRGDLLIKDCRRVRYEKFARPHELDIELNNGKTLSMHSEDAVSCAKWASILSYAIESPQWIHTEHSFMTFWRSSDRYESPSCPKVEKIEIGSPGKLLFCHLTRLVAVRPQWSEKLSLGEVDADTEVTVVLSNGSRFRLSLEDISSALLSPSTSTLHAVSQVESINGRDSSITEMTLQLKPGESPRDSTVSASQPEPRFLLRLRYRAELQLDRRIDIAAKRGILSMKLKFLGVVFVCGMIPFYFVGLRYQGIALRSIEPPDSWRLRFFSRYQTHFGVLCLETLALVAFAPLLWQSFVIWYRKTLKEAKLQWFLTLLSLEMQPETNQEQDSDEIEDLRRSSIALPSDWDPENRPSDRKRQDEVQRFRLENALDTILGRPQFPYFAIKKFFPNRFLGRDEQGRRVLLVSVNAANWVSLANHNLSPFAVERYFFYLWEFIWSYDDFINGVARSELVVILDCTGWAYWAIFGRSIRVIREVLIKTHQYYPGRLAKIVVAGNSLGFQHYAQMFCASLPLELCTSCVVTSSLDDANLKAAQVAGKAVACDEHGVAISSDEQALSDFVLSLLSTYATVTIPGFTKRELDQATRFTKYGSLQSVDDARTASSVNGSSIAKTRVGTKALLIPAAEPEWKRIYHHENYAVYMSPKPASTAGDPGVRDDSSSKPTRIAQMRGTMKMKSTDVDTMLLFIQDPSQWRLWDTSTEEMILLDALSSREDVSFWSREIPFVNFSSDGNRIEEVKTTEAYFNCLVRRIYEERPSSSAGRSSYTVLWKTTSSQASIINDRTLIEVSEPSGANEVPPTSQWKKFEDPIVTQCYVLEPRVDRSNRVEGIDLSFWFQVLLPATGHLNKAVETAKLLEEKFHSLDALLLNKSRCPS